MVVKWKTIEMREKLLAAWFAHHLKKGQTIDFAAIAEIFGEGTDGPALRFQFHNQLRPQALKLHKETYGDDAKVNKTRAPRSTNGVKKSRAKKGKKAVEEDSDTPITVDDDEEEESLLLKTKKRGFTPVPSTPFWGDANADGETSVEEKTEETEESSGEYC